MTPFSRHRLRPSRKFIPIEACARPRRLDEPPGGCQYIHLVFRGVRLARSGPVSLCDQPPTGELPIVYAIIEDGAHQYQVEEGATLDLQLHAVDEGQTTLEFDKVLLLNDGNETKVGQPYVEGARVTASIQGAVKGDKVTIIKMKRRKTYRRKQGHRQQYLRVKIDKIET